MVDRTLAMVVSTLPLRNVGQLFTACQVAPVLVDTANKVCLKPSQSTGRDAFHTVVVIVFQAQIEQELVTCL